MKIWIKSKRFIDDIVKSRFYIPLIFIVFLVLLATRRWMQLISPQIWDEDGTQVLYGLINYGWLSFFKPVSGYLIIVPKIISAISFGISFSHYPIISTILSWLFIALVGLAIALAPTSLRSKFFCAIAVFMVPSDPEVFGLPLYTFWWASILLFLVVLWDETHPSLGWRLGFLLIGGLSSPIIVLILPILYFRAYWYRTLPTERLLAIIATAITAVQIYFFSMGGSGKFPQFDSLLINVIPNFFGKFLIGNWMDNIVWLWLVALVLIGIIAMWFLRERRSISTWILLYLLIGSIALTVMRVGPIGLDPRLAGPRYFFFPFILIFWVLIQYFHTAHTKWLRGIIVIVVVIALLNAAPVWSRQHDELHWETHVISCGLFPNYAIPIQYDGDGSLAWSLNLPGKSCTEQLTRDFLISPQIINDSPTYPYTVLKEYERDTSRENAQIIRNNMTGTDFQKSELECERVIGSYNTSNADTGEVSLKLRRGDQVLYRSGNDKSGQHLIIVGYEQEFIADPPLSNDWVALEFSNTRLPDEFVVIVMDTGHVEGEWSAIAIPKSMCQKTSGIGVFRNGTWLFQNGVWHLDYLGNGLGNGSITDRLNATFGLAGDVPIVSDWNGDGKTEIGVFRNGEWYLDYNGNGGWDGLVTDRRSAFGIPGDKPVTGDWNGDGKTEIGVFRNGEWYLDYNGNGGWDGLITDRRSAFGIPGDKPVTGDWNGDGKTEIGVFRNGEWYLDYNGNGKWDGSVTDLVYPVLV